jgi:NitT/TauT family transport system permease protein
MAERTGLVRSRLPSFLRPAISFLVVLAIWWLTSEYEAVPRVFLPTPKAVFLSLQSGIADGSMLRDALISSARVFGGFLISLLLAIPLGILIGLSVTLRAYIEPLNDFIRYVPVPAMVPLLILWFGIGNTSQVVVIVFGTLPQLIVLIADATSRLPNHFHEICRSFHLSWLQALRHAIVPYASPQIYDGSRVAVGWAWSYLLVAEIVGATYGLGQAIVVAQRFLQTPRVVAVILLIAFIGLTIDIILRRLYPILYPWVSEIRQS